MHIFGFPLIAGVLVVAAALWVAGLRLFVQADLTKTRKLAWSCFLIAVGIGAGLVLPLRELWSTFLRVMILLPFIAVADVFLLRSKRGLSYWVRGCGFEVGTVFAVAAAARLGFDLAGVKAVVDRLN